jgi:hypothetical protein
MTDLCFVSTVNLSKQEDVDVPFHLFHHTTTQNQIMTTHHVFSSDLEFEFFSFNLDFGANFKSHVSPQIFEILNYRVLPRGVLKETYSGYPINIGE